MPVPVAPPSTTPAASSSTPAFAFGQGASTGGGIFSFGSSAPAFAFGAKSAAAAGDEGAAAEAATSAGGTGTGATSSLFGTTPASGTSVFGAAAAAAPAPTAAVLPAEAEVTTGEEGERTVWSGEGALFEYDAAKQWRERGRGEAKLNVSEVGARGARQGPGDGRRGGAVLAGGGD